MFDPIALFVEISVVRALHLAVAFGRDYFFGAHGVNVLHDGVGVVARVASTASALCPPSNSMAWMQSSAYRPAIRKSDGRPSSLVSR